MKLSNTTKLFTIYIVFTALFIAYYIIGAESIDTLGYDPFRFLKLAATLELSYDYQGHYSWLLFDPGALLVHLIRLFYLDDFGISIYPLFISLYIIRTLSLMVSPKGIFLVLLCTPALPLFFQTGKDVLYIAFMLNTYVIFNLKKSFSNVFPYLIISCLCLLIKGLSTIIGLYVVFMLIYSNSNTRIFAKLSIFGCCFGAFLLSYYVGFPNREELASSGSNLLVLPESLFISYGYDFMYPLQVLFRSIFYTAQIFILPILNFLKLLLSNQYEIIFDFFSSIAMIYAIFCLSCDERKTFLSIVYFSSLVVAGSYFFPHTRYFVSIIPVILLSIVHADIRYVSYQRR